MYKEQLAGEILKRRALLNLSIRQVARKAKLEDTLVDYAERGLLTNLEIYEAIITVLGGTLHVFWNSVAPKEPI